MSEKTPLESYVYGLASIMSVSGSERRCGEQLKNLLMPLFDEYRLSPAGSHILIKRCGEVNAHRLMIDTHFDEIGMMVTAIREKGFLSVTRVGGLDPRIMQGSEIVIYGKCELPGIICATPPHLMKKGEERKLTPIDDLLIDTGYSSEEARELIPVGSPVGFKPGILELKNRRIVSKGLDNKICTAAAVEAIRLLEQYKLGWDIYLVLAAGEETTKVGARTAAFEIQPDAALVLDVNLAHVPETKPYQTVKLGGGPAVSLSAVTSRSLTRAIVAFAKEKGLKYQTVVEIMRTGTDADIVPRAATGVPTAVISIPLKNMHTSCEVVDMGDVEETSELLARFIEGGLDKWIEE